MKQTQLSSDLSISPSQLFVADIAAMKVFYSDAVGLDVLESSPSRMLLGHDSTAIIELIAKPKLAHAGPQEAGLFHNAILFSSRSALSRSAGEVLLKQPKLFTGTGDHLVSEAFYFNDPEDNGVELYYDRPRDSWQWQDGHVLMDTLYIDPVQYIYAHANEKIDPAKKIGHVHLRVGDINQARKFYVDTLGFAITANVPGALFVSVGGYHHHIGLSTWLSQGAGTRTPTLGLGTVQITLQSQSDLTALANRLESASVTSNDHHGAIVVADPWGNTLEFTTSTAT